jgi:aryl-alcohol dehydrogenase-like predicted oxidoreductase
VSAAAARWLGKTGVRVSPLALGCMSFGGDADEATSAALYGRARDAGVTFFDTADVYNHGRSEEFLGRLTAGARDELVIATKAYFPTGPDEQRPRHVALPPGARVRGQPAPARPRSRRRLLPAPLRRRTDLDETLRAIDDLVRAGKILYPACSNFAAWQVARALGVAGAAPAGAAGGAAADVQPAQAPGRGRAVADGRGEGRRGGAVQPDRRRPAHRQVGRRASVRIRDG